MTPRRLALVSAAALALPALAACGGSTTTVTVTAPAKSNAVAAPTNAASILFLLHGRAGTIAPKAGGARGEYRVTLESPEPHVIAFTDRPDRRANHSTLKYFLHYWKTSDFPEKPPNVAMLVTDAAGADQVVVAVMSHPALDETGARLTFDATLLPDVSTDALSVYPPRTTNAPPATFARATIFVDANATVALPTPTGRAQTPRCAGACGQDLGSSPPPPPGHSHPDRPAVPPTVG